MATYKQDISEKRTLLMGVAMLSIMLFHQGWIWGWNPFFAFFHFYGNWGVDIFFFVSGFGLYYSLKKDGDIVSFYKRRLIRLIPLCLICGSFRYIVDHILPVGVGGYPTGIHEVSSNWMTLLSLDKWFIPVILAYYIIMPVLFKCANFSISLMLAAYLIALFGLSSYAPGWFCQYSDRFPSFCLGVVVATGLVNERFFKYIGLLAIITALIYKFVIMMNLATLPEFTYIILSFGVVTLCSFISRILQVIRNSVVGGGISVAFDFLGKHSLEIYLLHEFVYRYIYRFLISTSIPLIFQLLIGVFSSIALAFFFAKIASGFNKIVIRQ